MHAVQQNQRATLVVLDEVHHVAAEASWGTAVRRMIGDVVSGEIHARAVLNMTGTLFRSNPKLSAIDHTEPLKLLFVAPTLIAARRAARALDRITGTQYAYLVTSEEPYALSNLRIAAEEPRSCAIVTVRMVTEGFDCPHVATIAYATNIVAPLFVSQMMARAMRRTETERSSGKVLPAKILIPDHPVLRAAFVSAIQDAIPLADDEPSDEEQRAEGPQEPRMPRYELLGSDDPHLESVDVLDQPDSEVGPTELADAISLCETIHVPTVYAPRVALGLRHRPPPTDAG
ncbi:hypothetical protein IQ251_12680 [Saccharopolyspora sp. HNM0983]|uniref:Helicase ATP-binding domain-containing protein n=1 Tax=Saccharopolyspora montiporae TaxID=2781240 RepID=A0A929BAQ0_9PSEU|nr:hypothetical protein [Saccharopolyspora sp. HNM0983]MBE9375300.1 hypothetical protein [Saccharopolyspora sp. HNM0983]